MVLVPSPVAGRHRRSSIEEIDSLCSLPFQVAVIWREEARLSAAQQNNREQHNKNSDGSCIGICTS